MGLALLIVVLKTIALRTGSETWDRAARFWGRIFAINFVFGVVTGIPMEFEFGTTGRASPGFPAASSASRWPWRESSVSFLSRPFSACFSTAKSESPSGCTGFPAVMVWLGSWISGFFIIVTDAWMQHPVAYSRMPDGHFEVLSFWQLLMNPWGLLQYMPQHDRRRRHRLICHGRVGAFYLLEGRREEYARIFLKVGVSPASSHPSSSSPHRRPRRQIRRANQPVAIAAMEGLFKSKTGAGIVLMASQTRKRPDRQSHRG